ncbi:ras-domain-containing [Pyrrhoderma noxium]|uniref:Ras-domain-containing n=1 Tax=Pyrrhoderma noxium TaxID=2282107 RepID=A0A286UCT1_9AGAM|nr:ras-domain-containing [Pyrrhoderma noxium]
MSQAKTRTIFSEAPVNVKLLLIGNSSVGKSSLIRRFSDEQFLPEDKASATVGIDFIVHKIEVNNRKVKLIIWDTAGMERFRAVTSACYRGVQGIVLVYDITDRETFDALPQWYSELEKYVSIPVVKILVGNKVDKEFSRQVSTSQGAEFAERMGSLFIEASAKTAVGVSQMFTDIVGRILDTPELWDSVSDTAPDVSRDGSTNGNFSPIRVLGTVAVLSMVARAAICAC